jgi:hypothetical protein
LVPCLHRDKVVPLDGATNPTPPPLLVSVSVFVSASLQVWLHVWLHVHAAFMKWVYKKIDMHVNANGGACFVKTVTPFLQGTVLEPHISLSGHALVTSPRLDISPSSRSPLGYEHLANDTRMSPTGQCKAENSVWRAGEPATPLSMRRNEMRRRFCLSNLGPRMHPHTLL